MMMFLLHLASTPVYGSARLLSFSGERINGEYLSRQIVWAKTGRHVPALLDDGETGLESHSRLACRCTVPLRSAVGAFTATTPVVAGCHRYPCCSRGTYSSILF